MGNRAVIISTENYENNGPGLYVHWNGGRDSINGFLTYCKIRGFRTGDYGLARLGQVVSNFFGGDGLSVGIDNFDRLDTNNGDNGTYLIKGWDIVGRLFFKGTEQNHHNLLDMVKYIDACQPINQQLGEEAVTGLLHHNMSIDMFAPMYHYELEKMAENNEKPQQFKPGQVYKCNYNVQIEVKKVLDNNAIIECTDNFRGTVLELSAPLITWRNGQQSLYFNNCGLSSYGQNVKASGVA